MDYLISPSYFKVLHARKIYSTGTLVVYARRDRMCYCHMTIYHGGIYYNTGIPTNIKTASRYDTTHGDFVAGDKDDRKVWLRMFGV